MDLRTSATLLGIIALVAYVVTARIGRRSPHYGGGTKVLSWVGLLIPCLAWIAMFQGYTAVSRALQEADPSTRDARAKDRSQYLAWTVAYVVAVVASGLLMRRH